MFEPLIESITSYARLTNEEINDFTDRLQLREIMKGESYLDIGEVCQDWTFLAKGSFKEYFLDENLDEVITNLFTENSWMLNRSSFISQTPSLSKLEAFEDSKLLIINIEDLHKLIGKSPAFFALGKIMEAEARDESQKGSPEEKYQQLMSSQPALIQQFPLKYIASYLGMTPETLSRVRRRII